MDVTGFLDDVARSKDYQGQIAHKRTIPARNAVYATLESPLHPALEDALKRIGIPRFYTHQTEAVNAARRGQHVAVVVSTAGGKTICYNVPVLDGLLRDDTARALYLYPTKALAQNQLGKLRDFGLPLTDTAATFDGDTPTSERDHIRRTARIVLTNPDMLSVTMLPNHASWAAYFRRLHWVVIDEMHTYRGVFGGHVANVLRRLRRLCARYGSNPTFLFTSATIGNPVELARHLAGVDVTLVDTDGSPHGPRTFVLWNPPSLGYDAGRQSSNTETTGLFCALVLRHVRAIAFVRARQTAELIVRYTRESLRGDDPELTRRVASYRAGYTTAERRSIEQRLFTGDLLGVVSTNALELGVDIGGLDACVMNGYPGSIAGAWQQAGRAGRGADPSLAILVAQDNPLDQFIMNRPDYLFGRPHEHAVLDPGNPRILRAHMAAAAEESPITEADTALFGHSLPDVTLEMESEGLLKRVAIPTGDGATRQAWIYSGPPRTAGGINIRSASGMAYDIVDTRTRRLIGTEDDTRAFHTLHPGAMYLSQGASYLVERLDLEKHLAWVTPSDARYYTQPRDTTSVAIITSLRSRSITQTGKTPTTAHFGRVSVTNQVTAFARKQPYNERVIDVIDLELPPVTFETEALWLILPGLLARAGGKEAQDLAGGLHAMEHATIGLMPLFALCDRNDIGGVSYPVHPTLGAPAIFLYDAHPGGVGIAERCYDTLEDLLQATHDLLTVCPCEEGCPSCIQSPKCGNNNQPLDKKTALRFVTSIIGK